MFQTSIHKNDLRFIAPDEVERELTLAWSQPDPERRLRGVTKAIAAGIIHYWPPLGTADPNVFFSYSENWVLALLQRTEQSLHTLDLVPVTLERMERRDYRAAVGKGVGWCSQVALALADYLKSRDVKVSIVKLSGHVVAEAEFEGRPYLLDADYDVVMPVSLEQAEQDPNYVARSYEQAGWPPKEAARIAQIFGPQGNDLVTPDGYMGIEAWIQRGSAFVQWAVPILFIIASAVRWRPNLQSRNKIAESVRTPMMH